jgi:hypothetical protein
LESMIECKLSQAYWMEYVNAYKTLKIYKKWHLVIPLPTFVKNHIMGNKMEKGNCQNRWMGSVVMGKCKYKQIKFYIIEKNYKHSQGGYGRLQLSDIYTCHEFFQKMCKLEKFNLTHPQIFWKTQMQIWKWKQQNELGYAP